MGAHGGGRACSTSPGHLLAFQQEEGGAGRREGQTSWKGSPQPPPGPALSERASWKAARGPLRIWQFLPCENHRMLKCGSPGLSTLSLWGGAKIGHNDPLPHTPLSPQDTGALWLINPENCEG